MNSTINWTWRSVTATFLAGLFTVLPLVITVAIVAWVADLVHGMVGPETWVGKLLASLGGNFISDGNQVLAQLIGWAVVLGAIFLIGIFVRLRLRSAIISGVDAIFKRLPVIGSVYGTAAQFVGMLNKKDENELKGMSVVYCSFGETGGCGILALMPSRETYRFGDRDFQAVYIPTSPVPMTGGLVFVPTDAITILDMSVDKLMSIYLSMGVTAPTMMPGRAAAAPAE